MIIFLICSSGEPWHKYRELKKREEEIDRECIVSEIPHQHSAEVYQSRFNQDILVPFCFCFFLGFLWSFEKSKVQEQEVMTHTEENIISLLELCSRVRRNRREGSNRCR